MATTMRKILAVIGTLAILVALAGTMTGTTNAANLTGGTYTYVINGEETTFPYDPVTRKDGLLLPLEVFQRLGISVDGSLSNSVTLSKDSAVSATLTVGTTTALLNGKPYLVATAPLRLNGRVFLPADILKEFGVDIAQDGNFVVIRNMAGDLPAAVNVSPTDWAKLMTGHWFMGNPKADSNILMQGEFTWLTPDFINSTNLKLSYGMRAKLLTLLQTNSLVYVKLINIGTKSGAISTNSTFLVDSAGNQYDNPTVLDIGNGLLSNKLAPDATRVGVLVFPKVQDSSTAISLYYDPNNANLGTFTKQ